MLSFEKFELELQTTVLHALKKKTKGVGCTELAKIIAMNHTILRQSLIESYQSGELEKLAPNVQVLARPRGEPSSFYLPMEDSLNFVEKKQLPKHLARLEKHYAKILDAIKEIEERRRRTKIRLDMIENV